MDRGHLAQPIHDPVNAQGVKCHTQNLLSLFLQQKKTAENRNGFSATTSLLSPAHLTASTTLHDVQPFSASHGRPRCLSHSIPQSPSPSTGKLRSNLTLIEMCASASCGSWYTSHLVRQNGGSGAHDYKNRSNYDTSNRFGTNTLWGSLFKKITRATQNFNMAAIFQDGFHGVSWNVIFCLKNGSKWSKNITVTT